MKIAQVALQKVNQVVFFTPTEKSSTELVPTTCHFFQTLFKLVILRLAVKRVSKLSSHFNCMAINISFFKFSLTLLQPMLSSDYILNDILCIKINLKLRLQVFAFCSDACLWSLWRCSFIGIKIKGFLYLQLPSV